MVALLIFLAVLAYIVWATRVTFAAMAEADHVDGIDAALDLMMAFLMGWLFAPFIALWRVAGPAIERNALAYSRKHSPKKKED